jgi:hypothetical protein
MRLLQRVQTIYRPVIDYSQLDGCTNWCTNVLRLQHIHHAAAPVAGAWGEGLLRVASSVLLILYLCELPNTF